MASAAVVGPPPGLSPAQSLPGASNAQDSATEPASNDGRTKYSRSFLLKLSHSPLIEQPEMPPFQQWFGDWESYTPRQGHASHHQYQHRGDSEQQQGRYNNRSGGERELGGHGRHYGRMQYDDASGPMGEFSHSKGSDFQQQSHGAVRDGYLPGFQGVRRREGGPTGDRGERGGDRSDRQDRGFTKRYDDRETGGEAAVPRYANDPRIANSRFSLTGKNPFGQVSASGTFKPAGKDGEGRFPMGRMSAYGRERDQREPVALDETGKPIRMPRSAGVGKDFSTMRDPRRPPGEESAAGSRNPGGAEEEDGEWETVVPRSPDAERKLARAGALADAASDWRRGPGTPGSTKRGPEGIGGKGAVGMKGPRGDEGRRGGGGGSAAFPAWMAEEAESPSWMDDNPSTPSAQTASGEKRERGKLNFDAFKGSEIHATPLEGEDSIQAFKREMKERERRARERDGIDNAGIDRGAQSQTTVAPRLSAPPGLSKPSESPSTASQRKTDEDLESRNESSDGRSPSMLATGPPPGLTSGSSSSTVPVPAASTPSTAAATTTGGRGSSRFARFFDGAAATNKAKEAQERALAAHAQGTNTAGSPTLSTSTPSGNDGSTVGMEALFKNMMMNHSHSQQSGSEQQRPQQGEDGVRFPATGVEGGGDSKPSEADVESMHKIMALLRGGSGGGNSDGSSTPNRQAGGVGEGVSTAAAAGLMAMLSGGAQPSPSMTTPGEGPQQQGTPSPQQQRQAQQSQVLPPGLDPSRFSAHSHPPPGVTGRASPAPPLGIPPRAQSPNVTFGAGTQQQHQNRSQSPGPGFFDHQQQQQAHQQGGAPHQRMGSHPGGMQQFAMGGGSLPPAFNATGGGLAQSHGAAGRPPFDPRLLARPPPGLQGPPGMNGSTHPAMRGNGRDGPSGANPNLGNLLAGLPPHIQHQLMGLPPHVQHSILTNGGPGPQGMPPGMVPPRVMPPGVPPPPHSPYFHQQMLYGPGPGAAGSPQHLGPYGGSGATGGNSPNAQGMPPPPPGLMGGMPYYGGGGGAQR